MNRFTIETAKSAGFCFGVRRAVELAEKTAGEQGVCCTLGPLIHNEVETSRLEGLGVYTVKSPDEAKGTLIIRSHGVPQSVTDYIESKGIPYIDATCPFVAKIHNIVSDVRGAVIIAGDKSHPEVEGIIGHCRLTDKVFVVNSEEELYEALERVKSFGEIALKMVAQTTFNSAKWQSYKKIAKKHYTNIEIFDTICSATTDRQRDTDNLAERCVLMIVVGGKNSSNTNKLAQIS